MENHVSFFVLFWIQYLFAWMFKYTYRNFTQIRNYTIRKYKEHTTIVAPSKRVCTAFTASNEHNVYAK